MKDLNISPESLKVLPKSTGILVGIGIDYNFMNKTIIAQEIIARIDKWNV
jgi:hypothetical protein